MHAINIVNILGIHCDETKWKIKGVLFFNYLYYSSTQELHSPGFPVLWAGHVSNRTDPAENNLQSQEEYSACHVSSTLLSIPKEALFTISEFFCPHRTDISFSSTHFWGIVLRLFLCVQHCSSPHPFIDCFKVPFLDTKSLNGSHHYSIPFLSVTFPFGLSKVQFPAQVPSLCQSSIASWGLMHPAPNSTLCSYLQCWAWTPRRQPCWGPGPGLYPAAQCYRNVQLCVKYQEVIQSTGLFSFHTMHI